MSRREQGLTDLAFHIPITVDESVYDRFRYVPVPSFHEPSREQQPRREIQSLEEQTTCAVEVSVCDQYAVSRQVVQLERATGTGNVVSGTG